MDRGERHPLVLRARTNRDVLRGGISAEEAGGHRIRRAAAAHASNIAAKRIRALRAFPFRLLRKTPFALFL